jgi:hypothetical protein
MKLLEGASAETLLALEQAGKDEAGRTICPFCSRVRGVSEHRVDCVLEARLVASGVDATDDEE